MELIGGDNFYLQACARKYSIVAPQQIKKPKYIKYYKYKLEYTIPIYIYLNNCTNIFVLLLQYVLFGTKKKNDVSRMEVLINCRLPTS